MSATTTQGTGFGSGIVGSKGPDGGDRNIYQSVNTAMILPQPVRIGTFDSGASGNAKVTFDTPLEGSQSNYTVRAYTSGQKIVIIAKNDNSDGDFTSFEFTSGTSNNIIKFLILADGTAGFQVMEGPLP